jgi:CheY-like chemotaxis protein
MSNLGPPAASPALAGPRTATVLDLVTLARDALPGLGTGSSLQAPPGPVRVLADARQLGQGVEALCRLALGAGPAPGPLTVRVEVARVEPALAARYPALQAGRWACLSVVASGASAPPGAQLAAARALVQAQGGLLVAEAEPGREAALRVYLPAEAEPDLERPGLGQHLLLVDDHPGMARVSGRLLEALGYRATVYDDPREALAAFQARPDSFDAVFTDLCMPQMSGEDFARSVRQVRPPVPVIISSGLVAELDREELQDLGVAAVLAKPWRLEEVVATLRRVLPAPR